MNTRLILESLAWGIGIGLLCGLPFWILAREVEKARDRHLEMLEKWKRDMRDHLK